MEIKKNKIIIFFLLFLNNFLSFISTSPQCTLKLSCDEYCSDLQLIDGMDDTMITTIDLTPINPTTYSYSQYQISPFNCQPGDIIKFSSSNVHHENGGILCYFDINEDSQSISFKTTINKEKFTSSITCNINTDKLLKILVSDSEEKEIFSNFQELKQ